MKKHFLFFLCLMLIIFATSGTPVNAAANVGDQLSANSFAGIDGGVVALPPMDGKVYVLNLWATWCPPCRYEMPELQAFYNKYKNNDKIGLYLINIGESSDKIKQLLQANNFSMPVLLDLSKNALGMFATNAIPTTVVIDANGKIIFRKVGALTLTELEYAVSKAL